MRLKIVCLFVVVLIASNTFGRDRDLLKKIHSVEIFAADSSTIRQIFGDPSHSMERLIWTYKLKQGEIDITFTDGECRTDTNGAMTTKGWRVPKGKVQEITFYPRKRDSPTRMGFAMADFTSVKVEDSPGALEFYSEDQGITLFISSKGKLESITYSAKKSQDRLKCA